MQLFSRADATEVGTPDGTITPEEDGSFLVPQDVADILLRSHLNGEPQWETAGQRNDRLASEELDRRKSPEALYDLLAQPGGGQLTAEQLREAEEERKRIKAERELEDAEDAAKAQQKVQEAAEHAAALEQSRIDALPIHVGDTVKLADPDAVSAVLTGSPDHPEGEPAAEWRGVVTAIVAEPEGETRTDVASFEGQTIRFAISLLAVVDLEAEAAAAKAAEAERVAAEKAAKVKADEEAAAEKKAAADKAAAEKKAAEK